MELQACLDAAEVNRQLRRTTKRPVGAVPEMAGGDIREQETGVSEQPRGIGQRIGTQPPRRANARHGADWIGVYELSKKLHRDANSAALRGRPILIGPPQRGQFQVRASEATGALGGSRG
jgi:hypothetical protein